jgi:hypothetical protein
MARKKKNTIVRRNALAVAMQARHSVGGSAGVHADQNRHRYTRKGKQAQQRKQALRKGEW